MSYPTDKFYVDSDRDGTMHLVCNRNVGHLIPFGNDPRRGDLDWLREKAQEHLDKEHA